MLVNKESETVLFFTLKEIAHLLKIHYATVGKGSEAPVPLDQVGLSV